MFKTKLLNHQKLEDKIRNLYQQKNLPPHTYFKNQSKLNSETDKRGKKKMIPPIPALRFR